MMAYIIPAAAMVLVAVIEGLAARDRRHAKADRARVERRAADRAEESRLAMQLMDASVELGMATALAVEQHKLNGEMTAAKNKAKKAQEAYMAYIQTIAARQVANI